VDENSGYLQIMPAALPLGSCAFSTWIRFSKRDHLVSSKDKNWCSQVHTNRSKYWSVHHWRAY